MSEDPELVDEIVRWHKATGYPIAEIVRSAHIARWKALRDRQAQTFALSAYTATLAHSPITE